MNLTTDQIIEKKILEEKTIVINDTSQVYEKYRYFSMASVEYVVLIMTDNNNRIISNLILTKGTLNMSLSAIREMFVNVFKNNAKKILIFHNHPSGEIKPSRQDIEHTIHLKKACDLMDIEILDHMIVGKDNYFSFLGESDILK